MSDNEKFSYKYSSSQREEIEQIRKKYLESNNESELQELRKLDKKVTNVATFAGIAIGLSSTLIMGAGLTLILTYNNYFVGVPVGVIGIIGMIIAPIMSNKVLEAQRKKNSQKVIELTDKLLKN